MTEPAVSRPPRPAEAGFTLLEVLVALAILALSLAAVYETLSGGLRNEAVSRRYLAATILAEGRLAGVGAERPVQTGHWTGETPDGFRWTIDIGPPSGSRAAPMILQLPRLLEVEVRVQWDQGDRTRMVRLSSLRIGDPP
ncbi:prepilin-type N-terminal cleavage/methylation domain-containing protein [Rhodospirillaceae bacterium SYSU D60014]|uniref:prepilin-type N-terminal cleavage/methylation domain-containing protein n=1 Tax=Virgifigura deserti TaxID=2268457 RepID=UPI000E674E5C